MLVKGAQTAKIVQAARYLCQLINDWRFNNLQVRLSHTLYIYIDLDQHWLKKWFVASRHQAIIWTSINMGPFFFRGIRLRVIAREALMNFIRNMCSKITTSELSLHLPGANESIPLCSVVLTGYVQSSPLQWTVTSPVFIESILHARLMSRSVPIYN